VFHTSREAERLADSALPVRALEVLAKGTTDTAALRRQAEKAVTDLYGDDAGVLLVASGAGQADAEFWDACPPRRRCSPPPWDFRGAAAVRGGSVVSGALTLAVA
jgi:putative ABC transport system permease protein